ncbi:putative glucan 1,3-beta-glucosidase A [Pseudolycoriella hygida]|uniref:glucan 1,3-beta-glucosidase n=1 Tax=Pseudolycoriella hygida TaxID=35572 RepID=A0A9Q0S058_9DIPT|nr:putative glucan 1,3-beta-glucosidase A [Pseudolycoriella hygida]
MGFPTTHIICCSALYSLFIMSLTSAQSQPAYDYRTMKSFGVNLGSWVSLEKWIYPSLFERHAPNAIDEWTFSEQALDPAAALLEHWNTFVTEDVIELFAGIHGNHLRIPVGYWAFIQPDEGEPYVSTGQKAQLERILGYCEKYNLYAIIDLHGMPGSQNGEHHSGRTGAVEFYSDYNQQRSRNTIQAVVNWINNLNSTLKARVSAIQPVNEPHIETSDDLAKLKSFYTDAFEIINSADYKVTMLFGDGFQGLEAFADFLLPTDNAVIDLHPYFTFPPHSNTNKTAIIEGICSRLTLQETFHLPVFYGEWSVSSGIPSDDMKWFRTMMDTQVYAYKNGGVGFTFWTLRNEAVPNDLCGRPGQSSYNCFEGIAWSLEKLINAGIVTERTFLETPNQQCTQNPTDIPTESPTPDPNSAMLNICSVFLFMVCLSVSIKTV